MEFLAQHSHNAVYSEPHDSKLSDKLTNITSVTNN